MAHPEGVELALGTLGEGRQAVPYYLTFEDYQKETGLNDVIAFRLDQSVKAALYLEDKVVFY